MHHLSQWIVDLGVILVTASIVTLLFKKWGQPQVLGYLLAGFLVGPHTHWLPTVQDVNGVHLWAEIGIIFLLFSLGLEFSFKKLTKIGGSATIIASTEVLFMLALGTLTGYALGWNWINSFFLASALSISSTTIIVRTFDELNLKSSRFVELVYGVLIVEDLLAVLLLVVLGTIASHVADTSWSAPLLIATIKLIFFVTLWFSVGLYVIPWLLTKIRHLQSDETTLVIALGLCFLMVILAANAGFSSALGAFVIGSILAETSEGHKVELLMRPIKNLFAAVFFVSVGMLIDPTSIQNHVGIILIISFVTIFGKAFSTLLGGLFAGHSLKTSTQAGMSLAQIGEFSFIIITLGLQLKAIDESLYPIIVAVSAITTLGTPFMIQKSELVYKKLDKIWPQFLKESLNRYQSTLKRPHRRHILNIIWQAYGFKIIVNLVLVFALTLALSKLTESNFLKDVDQTLPFHLSLALIGLLIVSPFIYALVFAGPSLQSMTHAEDAAQLRSLQGAINTVRILLGIALVTFVMTRFMSLEKYSWVVMGIIFLIACLFIWKAEPIYKKMEKQFLKQLQHAPTERTYQFQLWSLDTFPIDITADSIFCGVSIQDSKVKEHFGLTIALIERAGVPIFSPSPQTLIMPLDRVYFLGTEEQWKKAQEQLLSKKPLSPVTTHFQLHSMVLSADSIFVHKTILDSKVKELLSGFIVGIERGHEKILNPPPSTILLPDDLVWIFADGQTLKNLRIN